MAIIISKNGKDARKIEQAPVTQEDYLQQYVSDNPDCLPLDEIKKGTRLLVVGREFPTHSGPIDVLAVDREGDLYIIETKLFKNPDKRLVVAQMLDYGAALWKSNGSGDEFLATIDLALAGSASSGNLVERLRSLYGLPDPEIDDVLETIKRNLTDGNIKFVVLMDRLHERLRDMILFINQKSRFNIYAVEMDFYQHDGMEIVIPRLFGAEVKKDVAAGSASSRKRFSSVEEFIDAVETDTARETFRRLLDFANELGAKPDRGRSTITFKLPDPAGGKTAITLFAVTQQGMVYIERSTEHLRKLNLPTDIGLQYAQSMAALVPGVTTNSKRPENLSRDLTANEVDECLDSFKTTVSQFVNVVKAASKQQ